MIKDADFIRESIHYLHHFIKKSIREEGEKHNITVPQMRIINEVILHNRISIKQLSENLTMTQSTVSDIVDRLTKKQVLIKTKNPADRRSVEISLSKHIKDFISNDQFTLINQTIMDVLKHLNPMEQETVTKGLHLLLTAVYKESAEKEKKE